MLVLTRKLGEVVVVRDESGVVAGTMKVLETRHGQVKLGFEFDRSYKLLRLEIDSTDACDS